MSKSTRRFVLSIEGETGKKAENQLIENFYIPHMLLLIHGLDSFKNNIKVYVAEVEDKPHVKEQGRKTN